MQYLSSYWTAAGEPLPTLQKAELSCWWQVDQPQLIGSL